MGETRKYRVSARFKEILDVLHRAKREGGNHLWKSNRRKLTPVQISKLDPDSNRIEIRLSQAPPFRIQVGEEVYLKLEIRDSAFKTRIEKIQGQSLVLHFPEEIALTENRSEGRVYFHPDDEKVVLIRKMRPGSTSPAQKTYAPVLADISLTGLALILSPQQSGTIQLGDRISLEMLGPYRVFPPILGEVVFKIDVLIRGKLGGTGHGSKVGIRLDHKIPKATFELFCHRERAFEVTDAQVVRDQAFRRSVHERMDALLKQFRKKKGFAKYLERFELGGKDSPYLKRHVELLCEVLCGLGTRLGWVSPATMDKLIYVAFLHDARYFGSPALARIPGLKEFMRVRSSLSADEQKAYLEGPAYASALARQDAESHPDAAKILLQQKECPDGSGFPGRITSSQFLPLSCLFIISHLFVDYVYDHPDWTILDFVRSHERKFKGSYFQKIFESMKG